ncbi:MAG: enoyl-CoA hydratase-related protein [Pseudomonadota bacterium]
MTDTNDRPSIYLETHAPLAELVLNKPERRNALSGDMWAAIPDLLDQANGDPDIRVIMLHGGTSGAFAAGADISEFAETYATPESADAGNGTIAAALYALERSTKPVIAAIEGACIGGGVSLALACDLRVASPNSKFGIPPARLGLVYPPADTRRLLKTVGPGAARDLLFTGRVILGAEARELRLIDRLVEDGTAVHAARELAREMASLSQWSVRAAKQMMLGLEAGWDDDDLNALALLREGFSNDDFRDGYKAFLEKRKPDFPIR